MNIADGVYDWNGRPVRISGGKIEDYLGGGAWGPSRLKMADVAKPGGDLSKFDDDDDMKRAMARVDVEAKGEK